MTGGLIQLISKGSQDIYLIGNPQISFFKKVYKRHTNFCIEPIEQSLNSIITPQSIENTTLTRNGDLISDLYFEIDFNVKSGEGEIYDIIDYVEILIGGQPIDRQYNDWNAIWWELTVSRSKRDGLKNLFVQKKGYVDEKNNSVYYPLNFWFCRNPGLALPLIACQYSEVTLEIQWGEGISANDNVKLWAEYIFLDKEERRQFSKDTNEYLIEQTQRQSNLSNNTKIELNLNHPVKEIIWCISPFNKSYGEGCRFIPMNSNDNILTNSSGVSTKKNVWKCSEGDNEVQLKLTLNGQDRFSNHNAKYFQIMQPFKYHTQIPGYIGKRFTKTFILNNLTAETTNAHILGQTFRPIRLINCNITTLRPSSNSSNLTLYSGNKLTKGNEVATQKYINIDSGTGRIISSESESLGETLDNSIQPLTQIKPNINYSSNIICGEYYGFKFSDNGSNWNGIIDLEFEELPTLIAGDGNNTAAIYLYSFYLYPEKYEPSGTCNFSRIDTAYLQCLNSKFNGNDNAYIKVFAKNYNILKFAGGTGNLVFSN